MVDGVQVNKQGGHAICLLFLLPAHYALNQQKNPVCNLELVALRPSGGTEDNDSGSQAHFSGSVARQGPETCCYSRESQTSEGELHDSL